MRRARTSEPAHPTAESILKHAKALQTQAAELADIITAAPAHSGHLSFIGKATAALAKGIIRARNARTRFFPRGLFSEPAWDILLELYAAELAQRRVAAGQLCSHAGLAPTTGLRWLGILEASRLIMRHADPLDARRSFVALSSEGQQAMESYFDSIKESANDA